MHEIFTTDAPIVLASASPRRQQFLQELGLMYTVVRPHGAEPLPDTNELPYQYALRSATAKAQAVYGKAPLNAVVIAADTVVSIGADILGKPRDPDDALRMLTRLNGCTHEVISAVCLLLPDGSQETFYDSTSVSFYDWGKDVLNAYAHCGEPDDKAGAYAIQGQGAFLVKSIDGSWSTVVGLPVTQLVTRLLQHNIIHAPNIT